MPAPRPLRTVAILGFGRFGRALADLVLDAGLELRALDPAADVPTRIRAASLATLVTGADVVVLAVPVPAVREALATVRPHLRPPQLVMDVASVKEGPVAAMGDLLGQAVPWVGTHPLFGPTSIARGERPFRVVVCPNPRHPDAAARATGFWAGLGCDVLEETPEGHDRLMAETHALTFFVAKGLLDIGAGAPRPFTPPSFQAIARTLEAVRSDAAHLFLAIQRENPHAAAARERLLGALARIHGDLDAAAATPMGPALAIPDLGKAAPELRETRELIDEVDQQLVALLARRTELAVRAARVKAEHGQAVRDAAREAALLDERRAWARTRGLDPEAVDAVFDAILRCSREAQARWLARREPSP